MNGSIVLMVPGRLDTATGGYAYDRRMAAGLRARGWNVALVELDDSFPAPTETALAGASRALRSIAGGTTVLVDGLAFGAMPEVVEREAARLRLVAVVHHPLAAETGLDPERAAHLYVSERRALAAAFHIVVTSRATASALDRYGVRMDRVAVVEPGTDPAPLAIGSNGGPTELLCVATLVPRKRHEVLVRALVPVADRSWHLSCVGSLDRDPPTVERLRRQLQATGLTHRVSLVGDAAPGTVDAYYNRADVFVCPTEYEGYGMAVAEALARGLPVVSTATGAIADLVGDDAGVLVPPNDAEALAAALARILDDSAFRARLSDGAGRARAGLSDWPSASARLGEVLERLSGR